MTGTETELLQLCTAWRTANDRYMSYQPAMTLTHPLSGKPVLRT